MAVPFDKRILDAFVVHGCEQCAACLRFGLTRPNTRDSAVRFRDCSFYKCRLHYRFEETDKEGERTFLSLEGGAG